MDLKRLSKEVEKRMAMPQRFMGHLIEPVDKGKFWTVKVDGEELPIKAETESEAMAAGRAFVRSLA